MTRPTFHLIAGPNGAGKTTFYETFLRSRTDATFVNPDLLAKEALGHWSKTRAEAELGQAMAAAKRKALLASGESLVMESTFSHPSKLDLLGEVRQAGYRLIVYHLSVTNADFAVERVADREYMGGHPVPEANIRRRYDRNGPLIRQAALIADQAFVFDNSVDGAPPRLLISFERGRVAKSAPALPRWASEIYHADLPR